MNSKKTLKKSRLSNAVCNSLICVGLMQGTSQAATLVVTSNADAGAIGCEFREAVNAVSIGGPSGGCVNVNPTQSFGVNDQIILSPNSLANSTITLRLGEISINKDLMVNGFEGLTIDGNLASRVFTIQDSTVLLNTITISKGDTEGSGGGIEANSSIVSLRNSTVTKNRSNTGNGGGISADDSTILLTNSNVSGNYSYFNGGGISASSGSLISLTNSKVDENTGYRGGGISANINSSISLTNSTVSKNSATLSGGGISGRGNDTSISLINSTVDRNSSSTAGGGLYVSSNTSISIVNSTISGNTVRQNGGGLYGAGQSSISVISSTITQNRSLYEDSGNFYSRLSAVSLVNSILANAEAGGDCVVPTGVLTIDTATIIQDGSCNTSRAIDPKLGPLAVNGGNTLTHALLPTSPARNTGILATCEAQDQRGQTRNTGDNACDVGAIEFNANDNFGEADDGFFVIPLANKRAVVIPL